MKSLAFTDRITGTSTTAFTLVELLVVIAILGILMALLAPGLRSARDTAKAISCVNNLKQQMTAFMVYTNDHDGMMPSTWQVATTSYWQGLISPTEFDKSPWLSKLFHCPSNPRNVAFGSDQTAGLNYAYNAYLADHKIDAAGDSLNRDPATRMVISDAYWTATGTGYVMDQFASGWDQSHWREVACIHKGRANMAWLDGHVSSVTAVEIQANWGQWYRILW